MNKTSTLYNVCPVCHGSGKYEEYDDSKANMIVDHYERLNYAEGKAAWEMAFEETKFEKECGSCSGNGSVLNEEGQRMYQELKKFA